MFLSLDISTSSTGFVISDESGTILDSGAIDLGAKEFDIEDTAAKLFRKMDYCLARLLEKCTAYKIECVAAEESLGGFAGGSSAATIAMLKQFNFCLVYNLSRQLKCEHVYLNVKSARKLAGISVPKGVKGKQLKEFVSNIIVQRYPHLPWPVKKTGTLKDFCYDIADAIVIKEAFCLLQKSKKK